MPPTASAPTIIRGATASDLTGIISCYPTKPKDAVREHDNLKEYVDRMNQFPQDRLIHVAVNDRGLVVGYAQWGKMRGTWVLVHIEVDQGFRERGIGNALIEAACRALRGLRIEAYMVFSWAEGILRSNGFRPERGTFVRPAEGRTVVMRPRGR